jgi:hypothetical protein
MPALVLASTTHVLRVVSSSTSALDVYAAYIDSTIPTPPGGNQLTKITTATTTTVLAAPGSNVLRNVTSLSIENVGGTSNTVTVQVFDGTNAYQLESATLAAGERLRFQDGIGFGVKDSQARDRVQTAPVQSSFQNTNITANAADTYVGGIAVAGRIQQGSAVRWRILVSKTAAGVAAPIFTFRTGTAGAVGDTSRVALTSPFAQTGVVDTGVIEATAVIRTYSSTGVLVAGYTVNHALAATGLAVQPAYGQSGTSATFDITAAGLFIGLSINPGTAGVWTLDTSGDLAYTVS